MHQEVWRRSRLTEYKNRGWQTRYKAEKAKSTEENQDYPLVGHMVQHEEQVTKKPAVKGIQIQLKNTPKSPSFLA